MKYDTEPEFDADFKRLKEREQRLFIIEAVRKMIAACKREPGRLPQWPSALRIGLLVDHAGIYEMRLHDSRAGYRGASRTANLLHSFCVFGRAVPVYDDGRFVTDDPGVVA